MRGHLAIPILLVCGACTNPTFNSKCIDRCQLAESRSFSILSANDQSKIVIWNMNSVDSEIAAHMVAEELGVKGYKVETSNKSDLSVHVNIFESSLKHEPMPTVILIDVLSQSSHQKIWSGSLELPFRPVTSMDDSNYAKTKIGIAKLLEGFPKCKK